MKKIIIIVVCLAVLLGLFIEFLAWKKQHLTAPPLTEEKKSTNLLDELNKTGSQGGEDSVQVKRDLLNTLNTTKSNGETNKEETLESVVIKDIQPDQKREEQEDLLNALNK